MEENKMKNIVVLKNLPSNLVEEAIVVLKGNKVKLSEPAQKKIDNSTKANGKEYILKEAEMIISNYISNIEGKKIASPKKTKGLEKKCKRLQIITIALAIALVVMAVL